VAEGDDVKRAQEAKRLAQQRQAQAGVQRVIRILEETRRELVGEVADSDWDRTVLPRLLTNVDRALESWRAKMTELTQEGQAAAFADGAAHETVLGSIGIDALLPDLPESMLRTFQQQVGQTIRGVTADAKQQIDRILTGTLTAGGSREEAIQAIKAALMRQPIQVSARGRFRTIEARARFIYQHEVGRVFATAQYFRQVQAMQWNPELRRVWRHVGHPRLPRVDHIAMHGLEAGREEDFVNPITGNALRFPRDPNGDISETANCTCDVVLWRPLYGDKDEYLGAPTTSAVAAAA